MSDATGFLARWSRRKQAAAAAQPVPTLADPARTSAIPPTTTTPPPAAPAVDPAIQAVRALLDPALPVDVRHLALRALWRGDPVLAAADGLDLHAMDGTAATLPAAIRILTEKAVAVIETGPSPCASPETGPERPPLV